MPAVLQVTVIVLSAGSYVAQILLELEAGTKNCKGTRSVIRTIICLVKTSLTLINVQISSHDHNNYFCARVQSRFC
jgi:hypothetical protein